jgi:hypothetical protein
VTWRGSTAGSQARWIATSLHAIRRAALFGFDVASYYVQTRLPTAMYCPPTGSQESGRSSASTCGTRSFTSRMKPGVGSSRASLVDEHLFELGLADVHGAAAPAAVVVRVGVAASFRPARRQRLAASLATNVAAQREVSIISLSRRRHLITAIENRLNAEEDSFAHERFEVAACRDSEFRDVDLRDVGAIPQHGIERLRGDGLSASRCEPEGVDVLAHLCFVKRPVAKS